jgi:Protein of unknown function (DUF3365)
MIEPSSTSSARLGCLLVALLTLGFPALSAAAEPADKAALAQEVAVLFRAARGVISDHQALINDASKGDKGLSGDRVVTEAKAKYAKAAGHPLAAAEKDSPIGQAHAAMFEAIKEVMDQAQPLINVAGKGFKGFLPAVFAKQVAYVFTKRMEGRLAIKLTAPPAYLRNRSNRPDEWETGVIGGKFASPSWPKNQAFSETATHRNRPAFRLMLPEYYGDSCMSCHGGPKDELDITGGKKEGAALGELGGAISVVVY